MWISFSVNYPILLVVSDVCNEIQLSKTSDTKTSAALDLILKCSNMSTFQNLRTIAQKGIDASLDISMPFHSFTLLTNCLRLRCSPAIL